MNPAVIFNELGGVPFIASTFKPNTVLTIVACVRRNAETAPPGQLQEYIHPEKAISVYKRAASYSWPEIESSDLSTEESNAIKSAIKEIVTLIPDWHDLFAAPIAWGRLSDKRISLTNRAMPQHIYLGATAFEGKQRLDEILIHEMSHVWLGIIDEITPIVMPSVKERYTLPSGTMDKDLHGVLLAAHFAASVLTYFYRHKETVEHQDQIIARVLYLERYLKGCMDLLRDNANLTVAGQMIASECFKVNRSANP